MKQILRHIVPAILALGMTAWSAPVSALDFGFNNSTNMGSDNVTDSDGVNSGVSNFTVTSSGFNVGDVISNVTVTVPGLAGGADWLAEVEMYLIYDPGGANEQSLLLATLMQGNNFGGAVTFNDTASGTIDLGISPYTGSFQPGPIGQGISLSPTIPSFAGLNGLDPNATWQLRVYDLALGTTGTFTSAGSLVSVTATPIPFTPGQVVIGVANLGVIALLIYLNRKK